MIPLYGHIGRIVAEIILPCISYVDILGIAVTVKLPVGGESEHVPTLVVKVFMEKVSRALISVFHPVEFPKSVEWYYVSISVG